MRGALEGVAFLLRTRLEDLRRVGCVPEKVVIAGGGSRNEAWQQLLGEVFELPLFAASSPSLSARGATLIAGVATGMYSTWAEATATVAPPEPVTNHVSSPDAEEEYQRWRSGGCLAKPATVAQASGGQVGAQGNRPARKGHEPEATIFSGANRPPGARPRRTRRAC